MDPKYLDQSQSPQTRLTLRHCHMLIPLFTLSDARLSPTKKLDFMNLIQGRKHKEEEKG
jgi:hypothetical protein